MNENPYQPPQTVEPELGLVEVDPAQRLRARRCWQVAALILLLPAMNNLWLFEDLLASQGGPGLIPAARWTNAILLASAFAAAGLGGLNLLEWITDRLRRRLGEPPHAGQWRSALYQTLGQSIYFAIPGALLWKAWLMGYYQWHLDFQRISIPTAILAHLLAAGLYLQLAYRWYKIEFSPAALRDSGT